ncbi:MAG: hypothetical protein H0V10_03410 [Geodermatophilaceae bacterium]|nr:hypothetical protein [Geodermatophilaceae bacterium]
MARSSLILGQDQHTDARHEQFVRGLSLFDDEATGREPFDREVIGCEPEHRGTVGEEFEGVTERGGTAEPLFGRRQPFDEQVEQELFVRRKPCVQ